MKLTDRQRQILDFLKGFIDKNHYPPSIAEICTEFGYRSPKAASDILQAIENKGYIKREKGKSRSITISNDNNSTKQSDLTKLIIAGDGDQNNPLSIFLNPKGFLEVPLSWVKNGNYFACRVVGSGLKKHNLLNGDIAICKQSSELNSSYLAVLEGGKLSVAPKVDIKRSSLVVGEVKKILRDF